MSVVSIKQLLEAGSHFGHQARKWNPKMKPFIFTERNNIHIINLDETAKQINKAYALVKDFVKNGKTVLFVGTKKQAQEIVKEEATRTGMFYVNTRWLGGTLTNFKTIKSRIARLNKLNQMEKVGEFDLLPKKEVILLKAERDKLEKNLGGIKDMHSLPDLVFIVDPLRESICVKEARALNIPIIAIVDTNGNPDGIDVVIPANDDANKSVAIITKAMADAIVEAREGIEETPSADEEIVDLKSALAGAVPTVEMAESFDDEDEMKRKSHKSKKSPKQDKKEEVSAEVKVEEKSETKTDAE